MKITAQITRITLDHYDWQIDLHAAGKTIRLDRGDAANNLRAEVLIIKSLRAMKSDGSINIDYRRVKIDQYEYSEGYLEPIAA